MLVEITIKVPGEYMTNMALPYNNKVEFQVSPVFRHKKDPKTFIGW